MGIAGIATREMNEQHVSATQDSSFFSAKETGEQIELDIADTALEHRIRESINGIYNNEMAVCAESDAVAADHGDGITGTDSKQLEAISYEGGLGGREIRRFNAERMINDAKNKESEARALESKASATGRDSYRVQARSLRSEASSLRKKGERMLSENP